VNIRFTPLTHDDLVQLHAWIRGVAGVDLLIGEEDAVGRGLGPEVLRAFMSDVVFVQEGTHACVAGVEPGNARSLRAFEKAGFRVVGDYEEEGVPHRLLRLERGAT
jgi:RimJ/RimL family protein N-acetyltransferase